MIETERTIEGIARSTRLKDATRSAHDGIDRRIMACDPFSSRARYGLFLKLQHGFHRDIDALYREQSLAALITDLRHRRRLGLIEDDLADLRLQMPPYDESAVFREDAAADLPTALGWLYVAEGSNLGAAILLKQAARLKLSTTFGARHLAGSPQGRARHWRSFVAALDSVVLSDGDEAGVVAGARSAFNRVSVLIHDIFAN